MEEYRDFVTQVAQAEEEQCYADMIIEGERERGTHRPPCVIFDDIGPLTSKQKKAGPFPNCGSTDTTARFGDQKKSTKGHKEA